MFNEVKSRKAVKAIIFSTLLLLCIACNNNEENTTAAAPATATNEEQEMKALLNKYPDSFTLIQNLAGYYLTKENFDGALGVINNSLKIDSINPFLLDMQSIILAQKGDTANAIKSLEAAVNILPKPEFIISLGALYAQTRNPNALEVADALLIGNKAKAEKEAYFIKGLYYSFNNEKEKAIPFFDSSIAASYTFMDAYMEKGVALKNLNKYKEAADVFEKAVTVQNGYAEGYYQLGTCYEKLNKKQDAVDAYNTAVIRDPSYTEAKEAMVRLGVK
jgi:tetratricopeptide (TPR) repeat protein